MGNSKTGQWLCHKMGEKSYQTINYGHGFLANALLTINQQSQINTDVIKYLLHW